ncbi:MAG: RNA 3'-terminal phosphate cyclase [Rhodocyclaceae bacterium]
MQLEDTTRRIVDLDGAHGEGGGQVLRSALTLSMITGTPFRIQRIRARRSKPGLLRQHLTAVQAAQAICGARVADAVAGSHNLSFEPGPIRGGSHRFAIGTAGSCTLVLQTVVPALWFADGPSEIEVSGGTHNPSAPPADFLMRAWAPLMARMGAPVQLELVRHGFYPAGGGTVCARVAPVAAWSRLDLSERGEGRGLFAEARVAGIPGAVAAREIERLRGHFDDLEGKVRELPAREGPGNVVLLDVVHEHVTEVFCAFGERGLPAEAVADRAAKGARHYLHSGASVGPYLADQLLLPMALAGGGRFTTPEASAHLRTNAEVISRFLPVEVNIEPGPGCVRVTVQRRLA